MEKLITEGTYALRALFDVFPPVICDTFHKEEQFFNMNDMQAYYYYLRQLAAKIPENSLWFQPPSVSGSGEIFPSCPLRPIRHRQDHISGKPIPLLKQEHLRLAVLKHDAHGFQMDKPGKDSYWFTQAGASCDPHQRQPDRGHLFPHPL